MAPFGEALVDWYRAGHRDLPWRRRADAYGVWLSEIMLQQTRVDTVVDYFLRFTAAFPTVHDLAQADEQQVLKLWQGLGYYSRARNLLKCARVVDGQYGGVFPRQWQAMRALPGVGDYTAAAVLSIAYGVPVAAVDGNVLRVIARLAAWGEDIAQPQAKALVKDYAEGYIPPLQAGDFTQAIMELGAMVCKPQNPACDACPLAALCRARELDLVGALPVKAAKKKPQRETRAVLVARWGDRVLLRRRGEGLLTGMWEFPGEPIAPGEPPEAAAGRLMIALGLQGSLLPLGQARHVFTHRVWEMAVYQAKCDGRVEVPEGRWADAATLDHLPIPTAMLKVAKLIGYVSPEQA